LGRTCTDWKDSGTGDSILMISLNEHKDALEWVKEDSFYSILDLKEELNNPIVDVASNIAERGKES